MSESKALPTKASFFKNEPFRIVELKPTQAPEGGQGRNWYSYVISQGDRPISGYRQGSRASVKKALDEFVERLNERRLGKVSVGYAPGARKRAPAEARPAAEADD